jgi:hypothetical protein
MTRRPFLCVFVAIAVLSACSTVQTRQDFDQTQDFTRLRTYTWYPKAPAPTGNLQVDNPLLYERIVAAVDRTLAAKGYQKVVDQVPDFYVNYHLSVQSKLDVRTIDYGGPYGYGVWGPVGYGGVGWTETYTIPYEEGTLAIDVIDVEKRKLVWRGFGVGRLKEDPKPEQVTERVNSAVEEILAQFPPEKK